MSDDSHDAGTSIGDALLFGVVMLVVLAFLLLAIISIFLFGPGMAVVGLVRLWGTALDTTQMWTFAIAVSLVILGVLTLMAGSVRKGATAYSVVSLALIGFLLLLSFGFKESGPETFFRYYFPEGGKTESAAAIGTASDAARTP